MAEAAAATVEEVDEAAAATVEEVLKEVAVETATETASEPEAGTSAKAAEAAVDWESQAACTAGSQC